MITIYEFGRALMNTAAAHPKRTCADKRYLGPDGMPRDLIGHTAMATGIITSPHHFITDGWNTKSISWLMRDTDVMRAAFPGLQWGDRDIATPAARFIQYVQVNSDSGTEWWSSVVIALKVIYNESLSDLIKNRERM